MKTMSISDARNHLPAIVEEVMKTHEQVVVVRYGTPTVAIVPFQDVAPTQSRYSLRGHPIALAENFDDPMPNLWEALAVAEEHGGYGAEATSRRTRSGTPAKRGKKG